MFDSIQHHHWASTKKSLMSEARFVYFTGEGRNVNQGGTATGGSTQPDATNVPTNPETANQPEAGSTEALQAQQNAEFVRKLDQLVGRDAIGAATYEAAKEGLTSENKHQKALSRMLASREVSGDLYDIAHECLNGSTNSEKGLGQKLVAHKINQSTFGDALADLEGADQFSRPLAQRLGLGKIKPDEYTRARAGLTDTDAHIQRTSQMLAIGQMQPEQFRREVGMAERQSADPEFRAEQHSNPVDAQQERTHDQITELMLQANVMIESLPERERTRPLLKLRSNLSALNERDRANRSALGSYLGTMRTEHDLDPAVINHIVEFDADTKTDFKNLKSYLTERGVPRSVITHTLTLKKQEWVIEEEFIKQATIFDKLMSAAESMVNYEYMKRRMIEEGSQTSGILLEAGTQIQYVHPEAAEGGMQATSISRVETVDGPVLGRDGNPIGRQPMTLRIHLNDGRIMTLGRFLKWTEAADVHETINTQAELEKSLGLPALGMSMRSGIEVEHDNGYKVGRKGNVIPNRKKVQLVTISDNGVEFSEPVTTLRAEAAPHAGLNGDRMTRQMNLGEYAKWARRNQAIPNVKNLSELRQYLRNDNNHRNQTGTARTPSSFPAITVEPGEIVQLGEGDKHQLKIKKADDNGVTFADGTKMSLPQFLQWTRHNQAERSNAEDSAERAAEGAANLSGPVQREARESMLKKAIDKIGLKDTAGAGGKTIFETISPFLPTIPDAPNPIKQAWAQTTFLSVMDVVSLVKEIWEFIKRKHQRNSKNRYGTVGQNLPFFLGTEMKRIQQSAENEEVNQYKEAMGDWGTWEVLDKLHNTYSKDEAKACFIVLTEKGELRWDDMKMWSTLNRLTSLHTGEGAELFIKLTRDLQRDPRTKKDMSGEDRTKAAIDALWGDGGWSDWFSKNINAYNSQKSAYEFKGKQLEADPKGTGGLTGELQRLLNEWKAGHYVNPHEYEELIDFAIKYGKMGAEDKIFYIIEGVTAKCPGGAAEGQTLLHMDRIGELDGQYLNQFPLLDFFTNKGEKPFHPKYLSGEMTLEETKRGYTVEDYESYISEYFGDESKKGRAGKKFSRFLWELMIVDPSFKKRLSKGLRHAENMDHDDAHLYIPTANMEQINTFTGPYRGNQKHFTDEGYKNGYLGFNQYLVSLSNRHEELAQLRAEGKPVPDDAKKETEDSMFEAIRSYYMYDSFMDSRRDPGDNKRARLGDAHYRDYPVNDTTFTVGQHKGQLDNMMLEVCETYGIDWQGLGLYDKAPPGDKKRQQEIEANMQKFLNTLLPEAIEAHPNGMDAMVKIVERRKNRATSHPKDENSLRGMATSNRLIPSGK
jgi:hypothetical protein